MRSISLYYFYFLLFLSRSLSPVGTFHVLGFAWNTSLLYVFLYLLWMLVAACNFVLYQLSQELSLLSWHTNDKMTKKTQQKIKLKRNIL